MQNTFLLSFVKRVKLLRMNCSRTVISIFLLGAILIAAPFFTLAQTAAEHASHHPGQASSVKPDSAAGGMASNPPGAGGMTSTAPAAGPAAAGGMGAGMGEMMKDMGKPPAKELYPSMMELPEMSPEKRGEIKRLADDRVNEGETLLTTGLDKLKDASRKQDFSRIQEANEQIRRGQSLFVSGLTAKRALAEDKDPRVTALQWFKSEMNLPQPKPDQPHGFFGLSLFHYITMLTIAVFAVVMIWMYFHKMKRANALVEKLTGKSGEDIPPPGAPPAPSAPAKPAPAAAKAEPAAVNPDIAPTKSNSWTGTLSVAEIFDETPTVKTFRLTDPAGGKLPFNYLPGQFITVTIISKGVPVKRSYTIASSPARRDCCEITVKLEEHGTVSHYLHTEVHEFELLQLTAPSGKFTFTGQEANSIVLIAGGVGVTPMMSTIRYMTDRSWKGEMYFFFSCKDEGSIIFREEIAYLQKRFLNLHVCIVLSKSDNNTGGDFVLGRITKELLNERVPEITSQRIHICGPVPMMDAVKQMLDELHVPKEQIFKEIFPGKPPSSKMVPLLPPEPGTTLPGKEAEKTPPPEGDGKAAPPEADGKAPPPAEAAKTAVATFSKSNKTAVLTTDKSILEASEDIGVNIDYSCRVGICGVCKVKLNSGKVTMAVEDALTEEDKGQNIILACQAKATEDVAVEA